MKWGDSTGDRSGVRACGLALLPLAAGCDVSYSLNLPGAGLILEATITAVVWAVSNLVYLDLRRKGIRGFSRFFAFWLGTPTTWVSLFMVPEGSQPGFEPPPDDEALLLREVRRDRLLRERAGRHESIGESDREATTSEL